MYLKGICARRPVRNIFIIIICSICIHLGWNWISSGNFPSRGVNNSGNFPSGGVNNSEHKRFLRNFQTWPGRKPRAAIYILTQAERIQKLRKTLESIDANFNDCFNYPIIIFHEPDLRNLIPLIRNISKSDIYFQEIEFNTPSFLLPKSAWPSSTCKAKDGYKHMCRFHSKLIYEMPIMQHLEYYWRLDDDSLLLSPITYDVFQYMRSQGMQYGYRIVYRDRPDCILGLWNAAKMHMKKNYINPTFFSSWPQNQIYYNNFEISNFSIWTQEKYIDYIDEIDKNGGIYYHRWGDAPIKTIAVTMFVLKNKVHLFDDIGYEHQKFTRHPVSKNPINSTTYICPV